MVSMRKEEKSMSQRPKNIPGRKTEKRTTLKGKKERKPDADNLIKKSLYPRFC